MKHRERTLPSATWKSDESKLRRIWLPRFGKRLLTSITTPEIEKVLNDLMYEGPEEGRISPATRNRHRALWSTMYESAIKAGHATINPVSAIPVLSEKLKTRKIMHWKEENHPLAYIDAAYDYFELLGVWAMTLVWSGLRIGESIALKWNDIDFESETLTVSRIFDTSTGKIFDRTKGQGAGGTRTVPLFPILANALLVWRTKAPHRADRDYVFAKKDGGHYAYSFFYVAHGNITEDAKVPLIRIHDIRHTFATNAEKAGFSPAQIQDMLGHADLKTTMGYTHVDKKHLLDKGKAIGFGKLKVCQSVVSQEVAKK